jgi:Tol biopolymer transport system component
MLPPTARSSSSFNAGAVLASRATIANRNDFGRLALAGLTAGLAFGASPVLAMQDTTTRISVNANGVEGNGDSDDAVISGDGRYVAFSSEATNLLANDSNGAVSDVFVRDLQTGMMTCASVDSSGVQGNGASHDPRLSGDGRVVAFISASSNLVPGDTDGVDDIFARDLLTGVTERVSVSTLGVQADSFCAWTAISADGRFVGFATYSEDLVPNDTNEAYDVFVHDRQTHVTTRVSVDSFGVQGNWYSSTPSLSADGRYVAFYSLATNLAGIEPNSVRDIFIHDRNLAATYRVTGGPDSGTGSLAPSISSDGHYIAFASDAPNIVPGDTNGVFDVFRNDFTHSGTIRASLSSNGAQGDQQSSYCSLSADGRYIAFLSDATNLVPGDTNGVPSCSGVTRPTW